MKIEEVQVNQLVRITGGKRMLGEVGKVKKMNAEKGTVALRLGAYVHWFKAEALGLYHGK